ncbi:MAG: antirestriction protein ArdA [Firmicutes bacterium]|nr:antirestriction protein ArdA [Bacillota bacterium]
MEYRIYVGTYAKYNDGNLAGAWIDPTEYDCKEDFIDACKALHKDESDPELMFQDWAGDFFGLISESFIDAKFWELIESPELEDDERREAFAEFINYGFIDLQKTTAEDALDSFFGKYIGKFDSEEDFAEEIAREQFYEEFEKNEKLEWYFDFSKYARDLFIDDYVYLNGFVFARY